MKLFFLSQVLYASAFCSSRASPGNIALQSRGEPNAPDGYTPQHVDCPSTAPSIRVASSYSTDEEAFLTVRRPKAIQSLRRLLNRLDIPGFDADSYFRSNRMNVPGLPNIGIAASGGGYRALMNGAGALAAFDSRSFNSTSDGHIGGVLQSATYISGLSGGSWLVGSLYSNNFTSVQNIVDGKEGSTWDFTNSILDGPDGIVDSLEYYHDIYDQVTGKQDAGYDVSVTDVWGRALGYQLINADEGGPSYTWSSVADNEFIKKGTAPLPLLVADTRNPGEKIVSPTNTVYEMSPFEFGSFDPTIYGFAPMQYVGSEFSNGTLSRDKGCINGYDSASFVMGTSSSLFNQAVLQFNAYTNLPSLITKFVKSLLQDFAASDDDIASWVNPFFGWNPTGRNAAAGSRQLTLVDGGEDGQNIPLHPLIQPVRGVDVIIAIDSSADTAKSWPNGTSLVATYERSLNASIQNGTSFPSIPDQNTFVNLGLNYRPTFFGCTPTNASTGRVSLADAPPLIVYLPNAPYTANSNASTFDPSYPTAVRNAIIQNGYNVASRGNATADPDWPICLGCALISRSLARTKSSVPAACDRCFRRYCWDGSLNSTDPGAYNPAPQLALEHVHTGAAPPMGARAGSLAALVAAAAAAALLI